VLAFDRVSMQFPGVRALDGVSFGVAAASINALMGENGAGKSTLLKILAGAQRPTAGAVVLDGAPRVFAFTGEALAAGIAVIYQELHLVPELSVAENLFLGHLPRRCGLVDRTALAAAARAQLDRIGESIDPATPVARLSLAQRQMVEIAKALTRGARCLAFDEPTSALSDREVRRLFAIIRDLRDRGCAILYVSHRMDEIFALCDRVTVLRDGRHIETAPLAAWSRDTLVHRMVGRPLAEVHRPAPRPLGPVALAVSGLRGPGLAAPCSFSVRAGEIFGLFGLIGSGRTELLKLLYGAARRTGGHVQLAGQPADFPSPRAALAAGVVLCPEDRKREGIFPIRSVLENLNVSARRGRTRVPGLLDGRWETANAAARIAELRIRTPSPAQPIRLLSGGNQQKVIFGRWLSTDRARLRVFLLDEPTRGIDVGAKAEIYALIRQLAAAGVAIVVVSSELPELLRLADRLGVMRAGTLAAVVGRADATEASLLRLALPADSAAVPPPAAA
jgi:L-arabinose transport system ATP-binding protein